MIAEYIVKAFAEYRREAGLSIRELETNLGIPHSYISMVESRKKSPSVRFLCIMCEQIRDHLKKNAVVK